jgi:hypothetical protein
MDVFSTELGIQLSFVKTSEFRGGGLKPPPRYATEWQRIYKMAIKLWCMTSNNKLNVAWSKKVLPYILVIIPCTALCWLTYLSLAITEAYLVFQIQYDRRHRCKWKHSISKLNTIFYKVYTCILLHSVRKDYNNVTVLSVNNIWQLW